MVIGVSAEMILGFVKFHGKRKVTLAEMFKSLSLEMGGDGTKITKKQLDSYIQKAENGSIKISKTKLKALKKLQENWGKISKDGQNITFADLKDMPMLLVNAVTGDFEDPDKEKKVDNSDKFNLQDYLKTVLNLSKDEEITQSDLEAHLKSLLSESSNDGTNADLVDAVTNLIASFSTPTTVEAEA